MMVNLKERKYEKLQILQFAFMSRIITIILQVIFNTIIPDHDANVFLTPGQSDITTADIVISFLFGGFRCWDSQYFIHVAQYGYSYENTLAFFPLFPYTMYFLASLKHTILKYFLTFHSTLLLSGVLINLFAFVITALVLFDLTYLVMKDIRLAFSSSLLFCINPANIFFSACYSEALFCMLTFYGLLLVEKQKIYLGALCFGLSCATRSNGILSSGFILYVEIRILIIQLFVCKQDKLREKIWITLCWIILITLKISLCILPFVAYQMFAYFLYCTSYSMNLVWPVVVMDYAQMKNYKMPQKERSEWCFKSFPISYTYVQQHYWKVGFLQYYELKQLPNFLLALPILILILGGVLKYLHRRWDYCCYLGFKVYGKVKNNGNIFESNKCFVYMVHVAVISLISLLCIHVQVTTRLVASSSPVLYWIAATLIFKSEDPSIRKEKFITLFWKKITLNNIVVASDNKLAMILTAYFCIYFTLGIILHVNFLPWT